MKQWQDNRKGFTLTELMIVVAIIALLAVMALPNFIKAREKSRGIAFIADLKVAEVAFITFQLENRNYPPNSGGGVIPTGMGPYLGNFPWAQSTPIGGKWNWDYNVNGYRAGVAVTSVSADLTQMLEIDTTIDDGDLSDGSFRTRAGGYVLVIED